MNFIIKKADLQKGLSICAQSVAKITTNPIMEGILFSASSDTLKLTSYDFSNAIVADVDAEIIEPGEVVISYKVLTSIISKCTEEIKFTQNGPVCEIRSGNSVYSVNIFEGDSFPELPFVRHSDDKVSVSVETIKKAIKKVGNFVANNSNSNPIITTVRVDIGNGKITFVACDGFRIAKYSEKIDTNQSFSINLEKATMRNIATLDVENVLIEKGNRHNIITCEGFTFITRTYTGEFIDYKSALAITPKTTGKVSVNAFGTAVNMATPIVDDAAKTPVRIAFGDDIRITSSSSIGRVNTDCSMIEPVEPMEIGFNSRFLIEALNVCDSEEITIELLNPVAPMKIIDENSEFLILPMRLGPKK